MRWTSSHDAQQITAPKACRFALPVTATNKLQRHIECLPRVVPPRYTATAVEIGRLPT